MYNEVGKKYDLQRYYYKYTALDGSVAKRNDYEQSDDSSSSEDELARRSGAKPPGSDLGLKLER